MAESSSKSFGTIPAEFGRYRILELLGQGGMGSVYLAHDTELGRKVALKIPKFRESESEEIIERFYREARASATLRSAHICPIYDVGEIDGTRYISMAHIEGRRLSDYLASGRQLSTRQIGLLVCKLALALLEAHDRGVVHRDLKPSNIMIDEKHEPIIMDFGLARQMDQKEDERLTQEGAIVGSPAYMSPEQVEGQWERIGPACDIYSLGVVLYELLTGRTPFTGSIASVIGQIVSKAPKKPSAWRPEIDPRLEAICLKMIAKRTGNRFASMTEVARALTDYLKSPTKPTEDDDAVSKEATASGKKSHKVSARDVAALFELSQEFMEKHDYAQVIQLLEAIPTRQRTNEILELLDKATDLQDEVTWLISDLKEAVSKHEYEGLLPNVKRLLELKPGHEKARKVYEQLTGKPFGGGRRAKRMRGFAARSGSRRTTGDSWLSTSLATMIVVGIVAFGLMTWGVTVYLRSDNQTVKVEIDDSVRADDVSVSIDGDAIDIEGIGERITLKRGDHSLEIKRGNVVARTQDFKVVKGEKTLLRISLKNAGERGGFKGDLSLSSGSPNASRTALRCPFPKVSGVAFSPDSRTLAASGGEDGKVKRSGLMLWDVASAQPQATLRGHTDWVWSVAYSPDGKTVASGGWDRLIKLWDAATGQERATLTGHSDKIWSVAFSPDGKMLASASSDRTVKLWDVTSAKEHATLKGHDNYVLSVAFSFDGKMLASASADRSVKLWDSDTGEQLKTLRGHTGQVCGVAFSPDGTTLASASKDRTVILWDLATRSRRDTLKGHAHWVWSVAFSPDGERLASASHDRNIKLWDPHTGTEQRTLKGHTKFVFSVIFSPDGETLASGSSDGSIRLWRLPKLASDAEMQESTVPRAGESTVDGNISSEAARSVAPDDEPPGVVRQFVGHTGHVNDLVVSADGKRALSASSDASIIVWDTTTREAIHRLQGHRADVTGVAVSPDARRALSGGADETVRLWDLRSGNETQRFEGHESPVYGVAISHDSRHGLSGSDDRTVRLWDLRAGCEIHQFVPQRGQCRSVAFSPDDRYALAGGQNGVVRLWSVQTGELAQEFHGDRGSGEHVAFSPDSRFVLSGGIGGVILWDIETGRRVRQFSERVHDVAFSPKGRYAFCGSWFRQLFLWDLKTGQLVYHVKTERNTTTWVAFMPDGRHALTAGGLIPNPWRPDSDFAIHLWRLPKLDDQALK